MGSRPFRWIIRHRWPALLIIDVLAMQVAFGLTYALRFDTGFFSAPLRPDFLPVAGLATLYWIILFTLTGAYRRKISTSRYEAVVEMIKPILLGLVILFLVTMDPEAPLSSTRLVLATYGALLFFTTSFGRISFRSFIRNLFRRRIGLFKSIIVGHGPRGQELLRVLQTQPVFGHEIIAVVTDKSDKDPCESLPSYHLDQLEDVLENPPGGEIEYALVALEPDKRDRVLSVIDRIHRHFIRVMIVPDFFQILVGMAKSRELYGVPLLEVFPDLLDPASQLIKRVIDLVVAFLVLIIGFPIMALVALAVKVDSKGPVLYRQKRVGYRGREFTLLKFRSMSVDAEKKTGAIWASEDDPRITRAGKFLRSSRLDELPQAWNVLLGHMSLVGPRPERKVFVDQFAKEIPFYTRRLNVKPGITGWAQVRRGYDASIDDVKDKLQYDLFYLENMSIGLDIKILINTIWVMFAGKGQ
ncbi:sugar transferase [bacterium]|nr:sugar transferase [bacterium]